MANAHKYRQLAEQARSQALAMATESNKIAMLSVAENYEKLARDIEAAHRHALRAQRDALNSDRMLALQRRRPSSDND